MLSCRKGNHAVALDSHRMIWTQCPIQLSHYYLTASSTPFLFSFFFKNLYHVSPSQLFLLSSTALRLPSPPTSPPPLPPSLQCSGWQMFGWLACHNNCGAGCLMWLALAVLWVLHSQDRTGQDISWGYGWRKEKWGYEQEQKRGAETRVLIFVFFPASLFRKKISIGIVVISE